MDLAYSQVSDRVERARPLLPDDQEYIYIRRFRESDHPAVYMGISFDETVMDPYYAADKFIKQTIEGIKGVANVELFGLREKYIQIIVDNDKVRTYRVNLAQLMGAFCEILYVYNTPIIYAENDTAFQAFFRILAKREATGKNDKAPEARWYMKPQKATLPVKDRKKYILTSLPYIGERLAENLLNQFTTIANIASASVEDLQKVPKIGKKKAKLIHLLFNS